MAVHSSPSLLPKSAEICVIGGGIIGVLTALELAERDKSVVLLEKDALGNSQSSQNLGWIRQQGRATSELPIMVEANALWREMAKRCGSADLEFRQHGINYLGTRNASTEQYERFCSDLDAHGVHCDLLSKREIGALYPGASEYWQIGLRTPSDGRVEPRKAVTAIALAAIGKGARLVESCAVLGIVQSVGGTTRIHTTWGDMDVEKLVISAGGGTAELLKMLGKKLPQLSIESTVIELEDNNACWSGSGTDGRIAFYRNAANHIGLSLCDNFKHRLGIATLRNLPSYVGTLAASLKSARLGLPTMTATKPQPSRISISQSVKLGRECGIVGNDARITRAWAGEIDVLPDFIPVIGTVDERNRAVAAAGFSGHGFGIAPGAAKAIADIILERPTRHDLSHFRLERFSDGSRLTQGPTF